jgi:catechol 2,3-dioxygenase-like lactoylglutathione lyase family enzyme
MKINVTRLDHVQLCIPPGAEDEAREFYGNILGLEEIEKPEVLKPDGGLWYRVADIQLHIGVEEALPPSKRHPAFEVENLESVKAYLRERGVKTKDAPSVPGFDRFSLYDPFGNRIEFLGRV